MKSISNMYGISNLGLIGVEYFLEKILHVEGNKIPHKSKFEIYLQVHSLLNLDTVRAMSTTNRELQV